MNHGTLFTGIDGFGLAAERVGWKNILYCEWNQFCQKVLKDLWTQAVGYGDITKTDFSIWRGKIDVLSGGFPCQPYSQAGKRLGTEDDRHLWPEKLRAIREIQPGYVVGENVPGLINWNGGLVFDEIQADLEAEGYEVTPFILPAAGVGAPHRRDRIWFVAYSENNRFQASINSRRRRFGSKNLYPVKNAPNPNSQLGCERRLHTSRREEAKRYTGTRDACGDRRTAWQDFPTQPPVCAGNDGFPSGSLRQRIREDSLGHLSEKEIDQILSKAASLWRNETIKAAGNAIVHQVAVQIFQAIDAFENIFFTESDLSI